VTLGLAKGFILASEIVPAADWSVDHYGGMIVVVEGPSGAGKTTWCRLHVSDFVPEYASTNAEPDGSDLVAQASFWASVNSHRWMQALDLERRGGLAVCDSDPLKLHYSWTLARIGAAPWTRFEHDLDATRRAFAAGTLGLADLVMVSIRPPAVLLRQRDSDLTRRRHSFDLHSRLSEPMREWYQAVDTLDRGRVIWELPPAGYLSRCQGPETGVPTSWALVHVPRQRQLKSRIHPSCQGRPKAAHEEASTSPVNPGRNEQLHQRQEISERSTGSAAFFAICRLRIFQQTINRRIAGVPVAGTACRLTAARRWSISHVHRRRKLDV
jgi:hypothetical protein